MSKFSDYQKQEIATALETYFKDKQQEAISRGGEFSQNSLARLIGRSSSYVSYILNRQFNKKTGEGNLILTDRVWQEVSTFLGLGKDVWDIENYSIIMSTLLDAKEHHYQVILDGPRGSGKTYTAGIFKKKYPKNTFYLKCAPDMTVKQFVFEMARQVGVSRENMKGSKYDLRVVTCEKLLMMDNPIVILDETETTTQNARLQIIDILKAMHDHKDLFKTASFVVMGANNFYQSLENVTNRKNPHAIPQFLSRFDVTYCNEYSQSEARKVCMKHYKITDIDRVNEMVATSHDYRQLARKIEKYMNNMKLNAA